MLINVRKVRPYMMDGILLHSHNCYIITKNNSPSESAFPNRSAIAMNHQESGRSNKKSSGQLGIGIDFGTSNSAAAIFDGNKVHLVKLENDSLIMPSATYVDRDYKIRTGQKAINTYIQSNAGRTVELSAEVLGEQRSSTGQIGDHGLPEEANTEKVYGQSFIDSGQEGRLFRGVKRLLASNKEVKLMVFNRAFRIVALITPLLVRIKAAISYLLQENLSYDEPIFHACIGHPVNFEGSQENSNNTQAISLLSEAYTYAEFKDQTYYPEPIAASLSYLHENPTTIDETLLTVDFGGGTLDLCVLKRNAHKFEVLATHGIGLGGDHIDQQMFRMVIFPMLGKGERWVRDGEDREIETIFPFEEYEELLLNWAISYMLNQNKYTTPVIQRMNHGDDASVKFRRLYDLIKNNHSYLIFQHLRDLKIALSLQESAKLDIPELDIDTVITRIEFEKHINSELEKFRLAVHYLLEENNLRPESIDSVIRTGGSCLIPAVTNILDELFPKKVIEHNPFTSVATGLAIANYQNLGKRPVKFKGLES